MLLEYLNLDPPLSITVAYFYWSKNRHSKKKEFILQMKKNVKGSENCLESLCMMGRDHC